MTYDPKIDPASPDFDPAALIATAWADVRKAGDSNAPSPTSKPTINNDPAAPDAVITAAGKALADAVALLPCIATAQQAAQAEGLKVFNTTMEQMRASYSGRANENGHSENLQAKGFAERAAQRAAQAALNASRQAAGEKLAETIQKLSAEFARLETIEPLLEVRAVAERYGIGTAERGMFESQVVNMPFAAAKNLLAYALTLGPSSRDARMLAVAAMKRIDALGGNKTSTQKIEAGLQRNSELDTLFPEAGKARAALTAAREAFGKMLSASKKFESAKLELPRAVSADPLAKITAGLEAAE